MTIMPEPRTIVPKIFDARGVHDEGGRSLPFIDRVIVADTRFPALRTLRGGGHSVRDPSRALFIWKMLASDDDAAFDRETALEAQIGDEVVVGFEWRPNGALPWFQLSEPKR